MKYVRLFLWFILVALAGCQKKNVEVVSPAVVPPKSVTLIQGDNQKSYPDEFPPDSIIIEVSANKAADLADYGYDFRASDNGTVLTRTFTRDNNLYIVPFWSLGKTEAQQTLEFYLTDKRDSLSPGATAPVLDSLTIHASLRQAWTEVLSGSDWTLNDMHFSDAYHGMAAGDTPTSIGYFETGDGGKTWQNADNSFHDIYRLSFADADTGIAIVTNNFAYFTDDGGRSFHSGSWKPPIVGDESSQDYFMENSKIIYTVGRNGAIAKTVDGGQSWKTYQGLNFKGWLFAITSPSKDVCYACGQAGEIVKTADGGDSWTALPTMVNNDLNLLCFVNDSLGFAAGQYGILIRTTDGGQHWETLKTGTIFQIVGMHFIDRDTGYIVTTEGEIAKTTDGGNTWSPVVTYRYYVTHLSRAFFNGQKVFGIQVGSIYEYDLSHE